MKLQSIWVTHQLGITENCTKVTSHLVREIWSGSPKGEQCLLAFLSVNNQSPVVIAELALLDGAIRSWYGDRTVPELVEMMYGSVLESRFRPDWTRVGRFVYQPVTNLRPHILPKLGNLPLIEINTKTVQEFVAYLASGGRSKKTVENVLMTLSSLCRVAKSWGYACGPWSLADLTLPREGVKEDQRCFTDDEMCQIISNAPEPLSTICAVTAVLGLRIGETLALRVSDIDFNRKIVRVRQSVDAATRDVQAVKSQASSADLPLPSQLDARLHTLLRKREGKGELLVVNKRGRPFSENKLLGHCRFGASKGLGNFEVPIAAFCRLGPSLSAWPPTRSILWDVGEKPTTFIQAGNCARKTALLQFAAFSGQVGSRPRIALH